MLDKPCPAKRLFASFCAIDLIAEAPRFRPAMTFASDWTQPRAGALSIGDSFACIAAAAAGGGFTLIVCAVASVCCIDGALTGWMCTVAVAGAAWPGAAGAKARQAAV
jgi:hypothetical protein